MASYSRPRINARFERKRRENILRGYEALCETVPRRWAVVWTARATTARMGRARRMGGVVLQKSGCSRFALSCCGL